jgi:proline-specific peptidase
MERRSEFYLSTPAGELFCEVRDNRPGPRDVERLECSPLICVHGGPGFTGLYLDPLFALSDRMPVAIYDQAGCGRARRSGARRSFTVAGFVAELEALRTRLGVDSMHLLGHSFGGLIIGEYILAYPERVASAIFASASIDIPLWRADSARLISKLPLIQRMILNDGLRTGEHNSEQYQAALTAYYNRHVYGMAQLSEGLQLSIQQSDQLTYNTLWGPNELMITGVVKDYSMTPRLSEIRVPTLFTCGRHDEATPEAHELFASKVSGAKCVVFERSAHHPQTSETEDYIEVLRGFFGGLTTLVTL